MIRNISLNDLEKEKKEFFWKKFDEISQSCNNHNSIYQKIFFCIKKNTAYQTKLS